MTQNDRVTMINPKYKIWNPKQKTGKIEFLSSNDQTSKQNKFWYLDLEFRN